MLEWLLTLIRLGVLRVVFSGGGGQFEPPAYFKKNLPKGLVTHNDILKTYRTITIKKYFQNILKSFLKYFRKKRFSKRKFLCKKHGYF